uniref:Ribosomal protein S14 n=1 Tax=Schizocladia ischiensis TaxID=196139 RepID=A0A7S6UA38_9STRA|nr:ribosomal protein S14 [Schizocladia ischiensis]QOW07612.1 ribosomal protein S14 [Schizocladia ischiensis]
MRGKWSFHRDFKRRQAYATLEKTRLSFRALMRNQNLSPSLRWRAQIELAKLPVSSSISRQHNRCVQTSRSPSLLRPYKLSRLRFRLLASQGLLPGIRKASW